MISSIQRCAPAVQVLVVVLSMPGLLPVTLPTEAQEIGAEESSTADGKDAQSSQKVYEPPPPGHVPMIGLFRGSHSTSGFAPLGEAARSNVKKLLSVDPQERAEAGQKLLTFSLPPGAREAIDHSTTTLEERAERYAEQVTGYCSSSDPEKLKTAVMRFPDSPAASTGFSSQRRLSAMSLGASATVGALDDAPILAILDSGVDFEHPDLTNRVERPGLCFTTTYSDLGASCLCRAGVPAADDPRGLEGCWPGGAPATRPKGGVKCDSTNWCDHGTHTAGHVTILDSLDRNHGVGIRILPVQVNSEFANPGFCHDPGSCVLSFESDRIRALHWLFEQANQGGTTVSAVYVGQSAGSYRSAEECRQAHPCMQMVVDNLWSEGIPVIAPVGNDYRRDAIGAPACLENVISVGASQESDQMAFFTNAAANTEVPGRRMGIADHRFFDFVAPGVEIDTAVPCTDSFCRARISGTSMAAAHVAAAWVRLKEVCGADRAEVVLHALRSLSRQKVTDSRQYEPTPAATDIPLVDIRAIDWDNAREHCENVLHQ